MTRGEQMPGEAFFCCSHMWLELSFVEEVVDSEGFDTQHSLCCRRFLFQMLLTSAWKQ